MSFPRVSIITLTYNHRNFIAECLESVYNQTFDQWEQIIIDDGSTDGTWDVIQSYVARDSRFRAFRQENIGPFRMVETYNRALNMARGELIAILEGDDAWPPSKLQAQQSCHKGGVVFSYGKTTIIDENSHEVKPYADFEWTEEPLNSRVIRNELLLRKAGIMPVSVMLKKELLLSMGGFRTELVVMPNGKMCSFPSIDYPTFLRYLLSDGFVFRTNEVWGYWRQHEMQTTQRHEDVFHEGAFQLAVLGLAASGELRKRRKIYIAHRSFASGYHLKVLRNSLEGKDYNQAKLALRRLIWWGGTLRRLEAMYGLLALITHRNMEWPFKAYEKIFFKKRRVC